jgi:hypothetical protein
MGTRNQVDKGLSYRSASLCSLATQFQSRFLESIPRPIADLSFRLRARICKQLWSPGIDSEKSISTAYIAWRASTTNRVSYRPARLGIDFWAPWRSTNTGSGTKSCFRRYLFQFGIALGWRWHSWKIINNSIRLLQTARILVFIICCINSSSLFMICYMYCIHKKNQYLHACICFEIICIPFDSNRGQL